MDSVPRSCSQCLSDWVFCMNLLPPLLLLSEECEAISEREDYFSFFLSFSLFTKLFISLSLFLSLSFPEWKRLLVFSSFIFFFFSEWGWRKERNVSRSRVEEIIILSEEGWLLKIGGMFGIQTLDGFFKVLPCVEFPSNWDESHWKFSVKLEKWLRGLLFFRIISFVDLSKVKTFVFPSFGWHKKTLEKKISWTAAVVVVVVKESFFEFKKIEVTFSSPIEVFETHVLCMIRKVKTFKSNFLSDCFLFVEKKVDSSFPPAQLDYKFNMLLKHGYRIIMNHFESSFFLLRLLLLRQMYVCVCVFESPYKCSTLVRFRLN